MINLRVGTWNVNAFNPKRSEQKAKLLGQYDWDLLVLQEVGPAMWDALIGAGFDGAFSLHQLSDLPGRSHGVAMLARNGLSLTEPELVRAPILEGFEPRPDFAGRLMKASVVGGAQPFDLVAFHSFHAAGDDENRQAKMSLYSTAHETLREIGAGIAGFDGNCWVDKIVCDPPDPTDGWYEEHRFLHHAADHEFRDAFHQWLAQHPTELARLRGLDLEGDDGCLAVTYQRSNNNHIRTNRMDRIYCSSGFEVQGVAHHYADALAVGSDHALVIADLSFRAD